MSKASARGKAKASRAPSAGHAALAAENLRLKRRNLGLVARSFEAAEKSRARRLRARFGSGDYHLDAGSRATLRDRSRDILRNDGLYNAIIESRTDMTIGRGLAAQADSGDDAWNRQAEDLWRTWSKGMVDVGGKVSFNELQSMALAEVDVAGDLLVVFTNAGLQLIESERIVSPSQGAARTPDLIDGVTIDPATGRHVKYHVADWDAQSGSSLKPTTKEISAAHAHLLTTVKRVSQTRGAPSLASVLNDFDDGHEFRMASLEQARLAAFLALVGKVADPTATRNNLATGSRYEESEDDWGNATGRTVHEQEMKSGSFLWIGTNESIEAINTGQQQAQFDPFWRSIVSIACAAAGLPPEVVLKDFTRTNYSSARAALLQARTAFQRRREWFIACFLNRVWRWKVAGWVNAGLLPLHEGMYRVRWTMPSMGQIDPLKEVEGAREAFANSFTTYSEIAESMGYDGDELMEQVAREKNKMRALGLEVPTTGGTAKAKPGDGAAPDEKPAAPGGASGAD